jgi:hypothetical protein
LVVPFREQSVPRVELNRVFNITSLAHTVRKKTLLSKTFILGLIIALLGGFQAVQAQYTEDGQPFIFVSAINIVSPANFTYASQSLALNITFKSFLDAKGANIKVTYSLDGKANVTVETKSTPVPMGIQSYYIINGSALIADLSDGSHILTVYGRYEYPTSTNNIGVDSRTVYFTVNSPDLEIRIRQPGANVGWSYHGGPISLYYDTNKPVSWAAYSIDGGANVTVHHQGELLPTLTNGPHGIKLYANSTDAQAASSMTYYFTIYDSPLQPSPTSTPTIPEFPTIIAITVLVIEILVLTFLLKRSKFNQKTAQKIS